jgi:hypothetical protein
MWIESINRLLQCMPYCFFRRRWIRRALRLGQQKKMMSFRFVETQSLG